MKWRDEMMKIVSNKLAIAMLLTAACWGGGYVEASAPDANETEKNSSSTSTKTVTESETSAKLKGAAGQGGASGYAESDTITVTDSTTNSTTTKSVLTISVKRLTLIDGSVVTFNLNGTSIGTAKVTSGKAKLSLSTKKGDPVPAVATGDALTVVDSNGATDLTGAFGAVKTETETSGK